MRASAMARFPDAVIRGGSRGGAGARAQCDFQNFRGREGKKRFVGKKQGRAIAHCVGGKKRAAVEMGGWGRGSLVVEAMRLGGLAWFGDAEAGFVRFRRRATM